MGGMAVEIRDVVFLGNLCGEVKVLLKDSDGIYAVVTARLPVEEEVLEHSKLFKFSGISPPS